MALVTVDNISEATFGAGNGVTMNELDVHDGGSGAVGGQRINVLPHPFGHVTLPPTGTTSLQLPIHPSDWRYKRVPWLTDEPNTEWNKLVNAGYVTLTFAAQAAGDDGGVGGVTGPAHDQEELLEAVL